VHAARLREREAKAQREGKPPRGPGPRDTDQYNFTDPESRIMNNSDDGGFDQHYNAQVAVAQASLLIVAHSVSNHPSDQAEAIPTLQALPSEVGQPAAGALDDGYFNPTTIAYMQAHGIEPFIATGREPHHRSWKALFCEIPDPPAADAPLRIQMAYRLRKCTVEPVIGIIKEALNFRQFSLRGLAAVAGEWGLVCAAFDLKRLHALVVG
jgi:hypothetical protein